jgi:hypothetical protein
MTAKKIGRPPGITGYTQEIGDEICERLVDGESLRRICLDDHMPSKSAVFRWLYDNRSFRDQYARAKEEQADAMADDMLDIADDGANDTYVDENGNKKTDHDCIQRARLRVDTRKWIASKLKPKVYGDRIMNEVSGRDGGPIVVSKIELTCPEFESKDKPT